MSSLVADAIGVDDSHHLGKREAVRLFATADNVPLIDDVQ